MVEIVILAVILGIGFLVLLLPSRLQKQSKVFDESKLADKIQLQLAEQQTKNLEKIIEKISQSQQSSLQFQSKLDHRFVEQINQQKLELEKVKTENQTSLIKIQQTINQQLSKSITELLEANKKNFELLSKTNQDRLNQINLDVQKRLDENFARNLKSFQQVSQNLGQIQSTAQKMIESTKSVDKLNAIFARTSSKSFGDFGEQYLETLLQENLASGSWDKQIKLANSSEIIDFVIYLDDKKIGIDSKFPLTRFTDFLEAEKENKPRLLKEYLRSVVNMAQSISQKYLKNEDLDSLLLYLPSDSMYSEVVNHPQTVEALTKVKVTVTSPATIFPLILLINRYQFKAKVNDQAEYIIESLSNVKKNIDSFRDEFRKLGDKIRQAQQNYDSADRSLVGVERNILLLEKSETETDKGTELL